MKRVSFKNTGLRYTLSPYEKPVAYVKPGESIVVEVEDASSGQIRKPSDVRDRGRIPFGNPLVGPIYVEGARPGGSITVAIEDIRPTIAQGAIYFSEFTERYLTEVPILRFMRTAFPYRTKICRIEGDMVLFDGIKLPYKPMVGTIGTAPHLEAESASSSFLPGRHGGNMDIPDICPGSRVSLPVFHEGALLYVGDAHAIQGDGEVSGTAVEIPAEITLKIDISDRNLGWPRIESEQEMMCVVTTSSGRSFEDAVRIAFLELVVWIEERYGIDRLDGLMICSIAGRIRVGNLWALAAKIEKKYLTKPL
ncbi:MAG: acetamidase/formamidase family protein [Candidatus Bathyarchaeia archaeon]